MENPYDEFDYKNATDEEADQNYCFLCGFEHCRDNLINLIKNETN